MIGSRRTDQTHTQTEYYTCNIKHTMSDGEHARKSRPPLTASVFVYTTRMHIYECAKHVLILPGVYFRFSITLSVAL